MEITIDEAIEQVTECKAYKQCDTEKDSEAFDTLVNIARKYQKIEEIVKQKDYDRFNSHNYYGYFLRVQDIRKVLDNGNDN